MYQLIHNRTKPVSVEGKHKDESPPHPTPSNGQRDYGFALGSGVLPAPKTAVNRLAAQRVDSRSRCKSGDGHQSETTNPSDEVMGHNVDLRIKTGLKGQAKDTGYQIPDTVSLLCK